MTPEQGALVAKAQESIRAARLLATEGMHDFAVSRAYYAMFYLAEALLLGEGLSFSKHSAVIAAFGRHFVKSGRLTAELHDFIRQAQDQRNRADYGTGDPLCEEDSANQIRRAERFRAAAVELLETGESTSS